MAALITQAEALLQLRLRPGEISAEDLADVMLKAEAASAIVMNYLKRPFPEVVPDPNAPSPFAPTCSPVGEMPPAPYVPPAWTDVTAPTDVKEAIRIVLTALYDGRTPGDELLSEFVTAILHRWRDPALA